MKAKGPPCTVDGNGRYLFRRTATADEVLKVSEEIVATKIQRGEVLGSPSDTKRYLCLSLASLEREVFACMFLDNRHRVISFEKVFYGTIDSATVHPREVVKLALEKNAAAVIFFHYVARHKMGIMFHGSLCYSIGRMR